MASYTEQQIEHAVQVAGVDQEVYLRIRDVLLAKAEAKPSFEAAHVAYYLGAFLIIGAMGWFITRAWDSLSGGTIFAIALAYGVVFGVVGVMLWRRPATAIPGGVLTTVAVCMTPLAIYGLERKLGWWPALDPGSYSDFHPLINGSWVGMEICTIMVAAIALRFVRFPFITAPAAYALWYMSMDATSLLFGKTWDFHHECWISIGFGLVMLAVGYFADGETDGDFAFWFYLFGLLAFTGGLSLLGGGSQLGKAVYCLLHCGLIVLSILLQRRAFLVFGALGVFIYLTDEATGFFRNSFGFTIALTVIGVAFIGAGILYKRNEDELSRRLAPLVPRRVRERQMLHA
jgi:hypothetical protein